jgi:hypothetical protein
MRLSLGDLRRIIREELLREVGNGEGDFERLKNTFEKGNKMAFNTAMGTNWNVIVTKAGKRLAGWLEREEKENPEFKEAIDDWIARQPKRGPPNKSGSKTPGNDGGKSGALKMSDNSGGKLYNDHGGKLYNDHGGKLYNDHGGKLYNDHGGKLYNDHGGKLYDQSPEEKREERRKGALYDY